MKIIFCMMLGWLIMPAMAEPLEKDGGIPDMDCIIEPSEIVDVGTAVSGIVASVRVERSDLVEQGAVLVELESSVEQASLELAQARASLTAGIELRRANEHFGQLTLERNQDLYEKSAVSRQTMDQLRTEKLIAALQVRQEEDNKRIATLEYHRARALLSQRTIRSPVKGVVMARFKTVGEYVEEQPLLRIAQLDPLYIETIVPVVHLGQIKPGMQANVVSQNGMATGESLLATVDRVDRVSDGASGTFGVRLRVSNPDYLIPAGLRCQLSFLKATANAHGDVEKAKIAKSESSTGIDVVVEHEKPAEPPGPSGETIPATQTNIGGNTESPASPMPRKDLSETKQTAICYTLGPYGERSKCDAVAGRLRNSGITQAQIRAEVTEAYTGTLALLAEATGSVGLEKARNALEAAGVSDAYVLASGQHKHRISLGYFSSRERAELFRKKLDNQGIAVDLAPRTKGVTEYWLDIVSNDERDIASMPPQDDDSLRMIRCPDRIASR